MLILFSLIIINSVSYSAIMFAFVICSNKESSKGQCIAISRNHRINYYTVSAFWIDTRHHRDRVKTLRGNVDT